MKLSHQSVKYSRGKNGEFCHTCQFYSHKPPTCKWVKDVRPEGWCELWKAIGRAYGGGLAEGGEAEDIFADMPAPKQDHEDIFADMPPPAATPAGQPSVAADVAKSAGIGAVEGTIGVAGLPGDIRGAAGRVARHLGVDPEHVHRAIQQIPAIGPMLDFAIRQQPTSQQIQSYIEGKTGEFYQPQTTPGQYARTVGQFAPAIIGGPEGLATRALTRAVIPGATSEAAGQLTQGTAAEPYARAAGALIAGGAGAMRSVPATAETAGAVLPSSEKIVQAAKSGYEHPEVKALEISRPGGKDLANQIREDLYKSGVRPGTTGAGPIFRAVKQDLEKPAGPTIKADDLQTLKSTLAVEAKNFSNPSAQRAAQLASDKIDDYLRGGINPEHVIAGNPERVATILNEADRNYAVGKRAGLIEGKIADAEVGAGSDSGNRIIRAVTAISKNPKLMKGLSPDAKEAMDKLRGESTGIRVASAIGNAFAKGPWHMIGSALAGRSIGSMFGPMGELVGEIAPPTIGWTFKKLSNVLTEKQAAQLSKIIRSDAPESKKWEAMAMAHAKESKLSAAEKALLRQIYTYPSLRKNVLGSAQSQEQRQAQE